MKKKLGIDQTTAWILAVLFALITFGILYWILIALSHYEPEARMREEAIRKQMEKERQMTTSSEDNDIEEVASEDDEMARVQESPFMKDWSYEGKSGPEHWGDLNKNYGLCAVGKRQSPIDIRGSERSRELRPLHFSYKSSDIRLRNIGWTLRALYEAGSDMTFELEKYQLKSFSFHFPSEHTVEGIPYDMEIQFMHKNKSGEMAIISLLVEEGSRNNKQLQKIWQDLPHQKGAVNEPVTFNVMKLFPEKKTYWYYIGSLTQPPCTEGVKWFVMSETIKISSNQVDQFLSIFRHNSRPTQPLYNRELQLSLAR